MICSANQNVTFYELCFYGANNHLNYRIDWAVGRGAHTLKIGVGEAF